MNIGFACRDDGGLCVAREFDAVVRNIVAEKSRRDEALVRRMLSRWPSGIGEPVLVMNRHGDVVGLGTPTEIGEKQSIVVYAVDFAGVPE